jgi:preprotein translocase subunit SecE
MRWPSEKLLARATAVVVFLTALIQLVRSLV